METFNYTRRRAIGSIIGGVFLVLIFTSMMSTLFIIENQRAAYQLLLQERQAFDNDKRMEKIEYISVNKKPNDYLNISVTNTGNIGTEIVWVGEINETSPLKEDEYHRVDLFLNPWDTVCDIAEDMINVRGNETKKLLLLTSYGNVYYYFYSEKIDDGSNNTGGYQDPSILLYEDFNDLPPGFDPPEWNDIDGTWSVEDDGSGNMVYYQQNLPEKEAISINVLGNETWVNYSYSADVNFVQGQTSKSPRGALLVFHYSGGNDYYYLFLQEDQDMVEIHNHGDVAHIVASTPYSLSKNTWYNVNVTIVNDLVNVTIDGNPCLTNIDMLLLHPGGSVGIGTSYYRVMFDNIIVKEI